MPIIVCFQLAERLRSAGIATDMPLSGNMGKKLKRANKLGVRFAVIVGGDELQTKNGATA